MEGDSALCGQSQVQTIFQSTPSVWKATAIYLAEDTEEIISIHAFRVEGDRCVCNKHLHRPEFQSTPSVWKATRGKRQCKTIPRNFNPRLPCGRRLLFTILQINIKAYFNPRLPCGRRPIRLYDLDYYTKNFNPRLPCGRRQ